MGSRTAWVAGRQNQTLEVFRQLLLSPDGYANYFSHRFRLSVRKFGIVRNLRKLYRRERKMQINLGGPGSRVGNDAELREPTGAGVDAKFHDAECAGVSPLRIEKLAQRIEDKAEQYCCGCGIGIDLIRRACHLGEHAGG